jgi:hypothetical protein
MSGLYPVQLVTVSSPEFILATRVMLHSFLATNPWFEGEITVLHARLSDNETAALETQFPKLSCRTASLALDHAIDRLVAAFPNLADRKDRFLSLETLLLPGAWPRLFIDSDVAVCGDLSPIMGDPSPMIACPDATMLRGRERDAATFAEVERSGVAKPSFNAGMMLVREPGNDMLSLLDPENWRAIASDHTDQAVWNLLFRDRVCLADPTYNFMVGHAGLYREAMPAKPKLLHFNGQAKPWLPDRHAAALAKGGIVGASFEAWRKACQAMLAAVP